MIDEIAELIADIEVYCKKAEMSESTFGRQVVNDGKFVSRIRNGKGVTLKTLNKTRTYLREHPVDSTGRNAEDQYRGVRKPCFASQTSIAVSPMPHSDLPQASQQAKSGAVAAMSLASGHAATQKVESQPFRFYDNRQKYLAFVHTCNEKWAISQRAGREIKHLRPTFPAMRIFDAGMGDGTVLSYLMRNLHRQFPTVPLFVNAKEISLEDVRLGLSKLPDRFCEHPATVIVISNLHYAEAPWLMPNNVNSAAALNWHEVRLEGHSAHDYSEQIESLHDLLADGWATRPSPQTGNPRYVRPSVLVIYREDHKFLLENVIPHPGHTSGNYDLVLASQPWRARMPADFKVKKVLMPLVKSLAPGGRLLGIQSYGDDPGLEIVRNVWPDEDPFKINRHILMKVLKDELGRDAREYNFNVMSDAKSLFRYDMHTLPSEIGEHDRIGTSTLFAAWNAAVYVCQIEDERLEEAMISGRYLDATKAVLKKYHGLWFNDETFVVSRRD